MPNQSLSTPELIAKYAIQEYLDCEKVIDCVIKVIKENKIITIEPLRVSRETIEEAIKIAYRTLQPDTLVSIPPGLMYRKLEEYAKSTRESN